MVDTPCWGPYACHVMYCQLCKIKNVLEQKKKGLYACIDISFWILNKGISFWANQLTCTLFLLQVCVTCWPILLCGVLGLKFLVPSLSSSWGPGLWYKLLLYFLNFPEYSLTFRVRSIHRSDCKCWPIRSSFFPLFSFYFVICNLTLLFLHPHFFVSFVWKSRAPVKVKSFAR